MENTNTKQSAKDTALEKKLKTLLKEYEEKLSLLESSVQNTVAENKPKIRDITPEKPDDYVEIRLFKDGDKYKDDMLVGINGYMCRIMRGVPVKVKRSFANVIAESESSVANVNADFLSRDGKMERYF